MEELLNKLIEKGREPFGNYRDVITRYKYDERFFEFNHEGDNMVSIRELVSKESGLWQFVCEKELVYRIWHDENTYKKRKNDDGETKFAYSSDYWIIQSSLCEEENIEQFLIENIKV